MPSTSRRRALQSAAGLLCGLAGCGSRTAPESPPTTRRNAPPNDFLTDPPRVTLRNPTVDPVVTLIGEGDDEPSDGDANDDEFRRFVLVHDVETATSLSVADVDGVGRARRFLDDTDFDAETVLVEQRPLPECYREDLCWVRWTDTSVETSYSTGLRDAEVACDAGEEDVVADFVRLPVPLDPSQVQHYGSGSGGDDCHSAGDGEGAR